MLSLAPGKHPCGNLTEPEPVAVSVGTFVVGVESSAAVVPNAFVADASVTWTPPS